MDACGQMMAVMNEIWQPDRGSPINQSRLLGTRDSCVVIDRVTQPASRLSI
jgi:hypothetical protein